MGFRQQLEEIVQSDSLLRCIHNSGAAKPETTAMNAHHVPTNYLFHSLDLLEQEGIDKSAFVKSLAEVFEVPGLPSHVTSPKRWVNYWIYQAWMGVAQALVETEDSREFHRRISHLAFTNKFDPLIAMSKFIPFGFVLETMWKKNEQISPLTPVRSEFGEEGQMRLYRHTHGAHVDDMRRVFKGDEDLVRKLLADDCAFTHEAYTAIFSLYPRAHAEILPHTQCETKGHDECLFEVTYRFSKAERFFHHLGAILPRSNKKLKERIAELEEENDELSKKVYWYDGVLDQERAYSEDLAQVLQKVQAIALRGSHHNAINLMQAAVEEQSVRLYRSVAKYMENLHETGRDNPHVKTFLNQVVGPSFPAIMKKTLNQEELALSIENFLEPWTDGLDASEAEVYGNIHSYHARQQEYVESMELDQTTRTVVGHNPWQSVTNLFALKRLGLAIRETYRGQRQLINEQMAQVQIPIEQIVNGAINRVRQRGMLDVVSDIQHDLSVPKSPVFRERFLDLLSNVRKYGGAKAEVYTAPAPPQDALERLANDGITTNEKFAYLRLADHGPGLRAEEIADKNAYLIGKSGKLTYAAEGTGMGTKELLDYLIDVRELHAVFALYSQTPGGGLTFELFIGKSKT
jgi:hypothetical protein